MILLFNTLVTDRSLNHIHGPGSIWDQIRDTNTSYKRQSKIDIFKYTIDSYRHLKFDKQFFFYELEDTNRYEEVNFYIKSVFPDAYIKNRRATHQEQYKQLFEFIQTQNLKDQWIFYSPNNDHPFTSRKVINIDSLLTYANKYSSGNVGIFYSHHEEFVHLPYKGNWFSDMYNNESEPRFIVEDTDEAVMMRSQLGENTGIQIINFNLFEHWFLKHNLGNHRIIRPEDLRYLFYTKDQLSLIPKFEICSHFDGQPSISPTIKPPLFIPQNYFNGEILIKLNEENYQDGFVNVNSSKQLFSFENKENGTDLKEDKYPLFWTDKISYV
jgi:hypothetical protein